MKRILLLLILLFSCQMLIQSQTIETNKFKRSYLGIDVGAGSWNFGDQTNQSSVFAISGKLNYLYMINPNVYIEPGLNITFSPDSGTGGTSFYRVAPEFALIGNMKFNSFSTFVGAGPDFQYLMFAESSGRFSAGLFAQIGIGKLIANHPCKLKFQVNSPFSNLKYTIYAGIYF